MPKKLNVKNTSSEFHINLDSNEIKIIRRTLENNTHEVIEDAKIKRITSWRKSEVKFKKNLIFNILSFGIVHLISLFYPNIYIKLYCIPWPAKECDFFLIENIYGKMTLCDRIYKKNKNTNMIDYKIVKENGSQLNDNNIKSEHNNIVKHITYSFVYKSCLYEYDELDNQIYPIYMNLSKMMNKDIYNNFSDGLSTKRFVNAFRERYGKNEYKLDLKLLFLFFVKSQIPSLAIVIIIGLIEYISVKNYSIMLLKIALAIVIIVLQLIIIKISFINKYSNEFSLDGNNKKIRVKRNYLLKNENQLYYNLDNIELLPGDIILLKHNDYVPCDCIIVNGECLVSESDLTGNLSVYKKVALKNNSEYFNYKYSNINILYHGMKIIKSFSKTDNGFISALCINIGPNTYKANLYSNTLYFLERKKEYNNVYNLFGERKKIFLYIIINLFVCLIAAVVFFSVFLDKKYSESDFFKEYLPKISIALICKSLMAVFFLIQNILIFIALIKLNKVDLVCFDKSRLIKSGKINTIIFNKTETLSENYLEINGYHPVTYSINKHNNMIFKNYSKNQSKDLNKCLFDYYQNLLNNLKSSNNEQKNFKNENKYAFNNLNNTNKFEFPIVLFLECLLCCNSIEKYDMDFFGNNIELELFDNMKWDIKQNEEYNNNNYFKLKFHKEDIFSKENKNINNSKISYQYYFITRKITDIFPKNYYKLAESSNQNYIKNSNMNNKEIKNERQNYTRLNTIRTVSSNSSFYVNQIQLDISNSNIHSFRLRIYKKFIINGSLASASIVYNFLTKELRFMIKGDPEEIINKCDKNSIPQDFEKIISINRKKGFIILVCATKKIELEEFDDNNELENYLEDLIFVGFLTLENKIKDYVKTSIKELKKFNDNFLIISGDNVYNCLSTGFLSGIVEDKNIFILDKEDSNKITIRKIYSHKSKKETENFNEDAVSRITGNISYSRVTTKIYQAPTQEKYGASSKNVNHKSTILKDQDYINNNDIYLPELNNIPELEGYIEKGRKNLKVPTRQGKINEVNKEIVIGNSEYERILNNGKTNTTNTHNKTDTKNTKRIKNNTNLTNNNRFNMEESLLKEEINAKYLVFMEKYYYHDTFKEYEDIKNSIFCMSGKILSYLNGIKTHKGVKNFMDKMINKSKIFFNMSSTDKSLLVDHYRESPNNVVCVIGQCEGDADSILSSDVGINLKNPKNMNTILCHYYSNKNDIICIKDIIINGKVFFENNVLLESISFGCTLILNAYLLCCILRNVIINQGEINFLEIEYLILATLSFLSKTKENIYINQNSKLLNFYYYLQLGENIAFKLLGIFLFCLLFRGDTSFDEHLLDREFLSYFFVLNIEFLICGIIAFSFVSFYKESALSNFYLIVFINVYLIYIVLLLFFNSSNYSSDVLSITHFIRNEKIMDCFSDKNKSYLLVSLLFDFLGTVIMNLITYLIFNFLVK